MTQSCREYFPGHAFYDLPETFLLEIISRFPTPFYLIDANCLQKRVEWLKEQFSGIKLFFPFKSCPVGWTRHQMRKYKIGSDVCSKKELEALLILQETVGSFIYNSAAPTYEEMFLAASEHGIIVINDVDDFRLLKQVSNKLGRNVPYLVRVALSSLNQRQSRFGTELDSLQSLLSNILTEPKAHLPEGFHFHLGTNIGQIETYRRAFRSLCKEVKKLEGKFDADFKVIDIGGGYATPTSLFRRPFKRPEYFFPENLAQEIQIVLDELGLKNKEVWAEPGRLLAEESALFITSVEKILKNKGIPCAIVNGGSHLIPTALHANHPVKLLGKTDEVAQEWILYGRTCIEKDILSVNAKLARELAKDDVLIFGGVGAYDMGMAYPFSNGMPSTYVICENGSIQKFTSCPV